MAVPQIVIYVRHSAGCEHAADEQYRRCHCRKHLRWNVNGHQYRVSAKTRTWTEAEEEKRKVEDRYRTGETPKEAPTVKTISERVDEFIVAKESQNLTAGVIGKYRLELTRLATFLAERGITLPKQITLNELYAFRKTWEKTYCSTLTQRAVQERLRGFLSYLHDSGYIERIPRMNAIKVQEPPTIPLSKEEYKKLLGAVDEELKDKQCAARARGLIRLMRNTGLAITDASTLERTAIQFDKKKEIYRIVTSRQKTGTHVSVPIKKDLAEELLAITNGNPQYVFWNSQGGDKESTAKKWAKLLRRIFTKAGLPNGHSHQLRDTFAVDLLAKGVPLEEVSKLLGHTSIKTTERSYAPWVHARQDRLDTLVTASWEKK